MSELSLTTPSVEPSQPTLLRDVFFVAEHADRINAYIRATPDMALLPISDAQSQTLAELKSSPFRYRLGPTTCHRFVSLN
ncbi:unnamed protein product [Nippostrongylus brasiliensis]|uniref:Phenazine biosynthesis protein n=1 Tax=Nippostrongylus brasiliensis TaxID=27835 RepID=A0A0N4Y4S0_NIPBR|nr:unnamed protein product [Nippostrongylus brasiliensis]